MFIIIPLLQIVFKLKFFLAKHESYIILKVFKVKVLSVFGFDAFLTMLNALWWIYKKARRGIFDFMFLVSSVLVMVSKNLLFCFGQGHIELFQCSAEGCFPLFPAISLCFSLFSIVPPVLPCFPLFPTASSQCSQVQMEEWRSRSNLNGSLSPPVNISAIPPGPPSV